MAVVLIVLASHAAHQVLMTRLGHFMHEAVNVDIGFGSERPHVAILVHSEGEILSEAIL